ncbi:alpha-ketoacid dehydrogenase subunit alpha/beta [Xanthocytophaga flava]|uniref:alpha-ketoacid dehydrogenase subunit alpha/beta n=1 Tax=Xanthocytophaga flava TaxID=3048013 RepID=UPI0028D3BC75|nr:thiamine pyrophosphate-dependent enzyme [Xanthocytophaga flavus]MDJ1470443.1 thiamine pyrophosphate-dependent enzyme [Xanthocytophaga flavus]
MSKYYTTLNADTLKKAYELMCTTQHIQNVYKKNADQIPYQYSSSRGHEAIQIAVAMHLKPHDFLFPYYRDESMLLTMGIQPYELMLQLLARKEDPFSGGKMPYLHPILQREDMPQIPIPGNYTGSHSIPATGLAQGLMYLLSQNLRMDFDRPVVLCSLGDAVITEGEISEAFHIAILKKLPIIYLVQDNDWGGTVKSDEIRAVDAYELAGGFKGMKRVRINGADFVDAYDKVQIAIDYARLERMPVLLHAKCPLLDDHISGVSHTLYRSEENFALHQRDEPIERLRRYLLIEGETEESIDKIGQNIEQTINDSFEYASISQQPDTGNIMLYRFAPTKVIEEEGNRNTDASEKITMRQAAIQALDELLTENPEAIYSGMEIGSPLGGIHREAAGLAQKHGNERVISMPAAESYLIGSIMGLAAAGCKPIVSMPSTKSIFLAMNQLNRLSEAFYLSNGKIIVSSVIRVPIESVGIETLLLQFKGIKIAYPSSAADMKGILKSAFVDPNPVILLEHTSLYDLKEAESPAPASDYVLPLGKSRIAQYSAEESRNEGNSLVVITYGPGVHRTIAASANYPGSVEVLDLRTLSPLDWDAIMSAVKRHGKAMIVTMESQRGSFAEMLAGRITQQCFRFLDAPVFTCGAASLPAIPVNQQLAETAIPTADKIAEVIGQLLSY